MGNNNSRSQSSNSGRRQSPSVQNDSHGRIVEDPKNVNRNGVFQKPVMWIGGVVFFVVALFLAIPYLNAGGENDNSGPKNEFKLTVSPSPVTGGESARVTIVVPPDTPLNSQINVTCNKPEVKIIRSTIELLSKGQKLEFVVQTPKTDKDLLAKITATIAKQPGTESGNPTANADIQIIAQAPGLTNTRHSIEIKESTVKVGEPREGFILLQTPATKDVIVNLRSDPKGIAFEPQNPTIANGDTVARFKLEAPSDFDKSEFKIVSEINGVDVPSKSITVVHAPSFHFSRELGISIISLIVGIGSILYSVLSLQTYRKSAAHDAARYVDEGIDARLKDIKQEQSIRVTPGASNPFSSPKATSDDFISREQFNTRIVAINDFLQTTQTNNLQLQAQIDELRRSISVILEQSRQNPPSSVQTAGTQVVVTTQAVSTPVLSDDEQLKLLEIEELLEQPDNYGRVKLATNQWETFSHGLRSRILEKLSRPGITIIEPKRGDPVDESIMEIGGVPENYRMRVKEVVTLGFRIHSSGGVFLAKVIVE